jgi:chemotaxis protein histidine kinase CheA/ActR/RegA family two-component response regulator
MEQDAQQRILEYFIEEASDHLNMMEQGLMELQYSDDPADVLRELFRGAHSVKGGAAMLGLQAILSISHQLEDYFKILQDRQLHIDQELEGYLLQGLDILKVMFYALPTVDPIINEQCLADMKPLGRKIEAKLNNLSAEPFEEIITSDYSSELVYTEWNPSELVYTEESVPTPEPEPFHAPEPLPVEHLVAPLPIETVQKALVPVATTLVHTPLSPDEQRILGYFIEEAQENLATAERNLAALRKPDADPDLDPDELREELYRSFHSLKGGAAMLHLQAIRQIAFRMEHFCREVHMQPALLDAVLNDYLGQGRLLLEGIVNRLPEVNLELDEAALQASDPLMTRIENKLNGIETVDADVVAATPEVVSVMELPQEEPELIVASTEPLVVVEEPAFIEAVSASEIVASVESDWAEPVFSEAFEAPETIEEVFGGLPELIVAEETLPTIEAIETEPESMAVEPAYEPEAIELIFAPEEVAQVEPEFISVPAISAIDPAESEFIEIAPAIEAAAPPELETVEVISAVEAIDPIESEFVEVTAIEAIDPVEPEFIEVTPAIEAMAQLEPEAIFIAAVGMVASMPTIMAEAQETANVEAAEVIPAVETLAEPELEILEVISTVEAASSIEPEIVEAIPALEALAEPEFIAAVAEPPSIPTDFLEQIDEGIYTLQECFIQPRFEPIREEILTLTRTLTELGAVYGFSGFERLCQTLAMALLRSGEEHWQEMGFRTLAEFQQAKALIRQGDGAKVKPSNWLMECAGFQVELPEPEVVEVVVEEQPEALQAMIPEQEINPDPEIIPEVEVLIAVTETLAEPVETEELVEPEIAVALTEEELSEPESAENQGLTTLTLETLMSAEFQNDEEPIEAPPQTVEAVAEPEEEDPLGDILAQLFAPPKADFIAAQVQASVIEKQIQQEQDTIASLSSIFPEDEAEPMTAALETSSRSDAESLEDLFTAMPEVELERAVSTPVAQELAAMSASEADMDLAALFGASAIGALEVTGSTKAVPPTPVTPKEPPTAPPTARPARRPARAESTPEKNGREVARPAAAASSEPRAPLTGPVVRRTMRVEVRHLDGLSNLVGELVINRNTLENQQIRLRSSLEMLQQRVSKMDRVSRELEEYYDKSVLGIQAPGASSNPIDSINRGQEAFDALEMDRYTAFHTLSQEIMELIVRIKEASSDIEFVVDESDETSRQFRQTSSQLQEGLNQIRMLPLSELVDRLPRAVRDLSINMGKEVELELLGRETLLDKAILEELYDPLTHLTTNALMHGIEPIEERRRLNKKAKGKITVSASHQGNQTIIAVKDDGRGLDARRIRAKAVERGLLSAEQAAVMTDSEVFPLIFLPGFSTVEQVTEIAGRGVGMDVVQNRLNRLRGNVLIDSTPGEGTTFTIRLPLTLSISRAILCRHGQGMIAFPLDSIDEMVELPTNRIKAEGKRRYILWRDRFIPFVPLTELLMYQRPGLATSQDFMKEKEVATVILRGGDAYVAVGVDAFIEEQEIVIKQLKGPVDKPQGLAGVTVLGNGQVMPIADVGELIGMVTGQLPALKEIKPYRPTKVVKQPSQPTVLIVDDSITVRELLSMTFVKAGYRVEQARDGQEATEKLKAGLACDMVFCDVEMPRMDGFEFLSQVQKDSRLNHIPVAMLTSRSADKHRQTAYQLGAKGYFTKPYLEEDLLRGAELLLKGGQMAMV